MASIPNVKPGFTTSEWWSHVLTLAVACGVAVAGVIHPGYKVPDWVAQLAGPAAVALAAVSTAVYTWSRTAIKKAALARPAPPVIAMSSGSPMNSMSAGPDTVTFSGPPSTGGTVATAIADALQAKPVPDSNLEAVAGEPHPNVDVQTEAHPGAQAAAPPVETAIGQPEGNMTP